MRERRLEQDAARRQREELTRQAEVAERAEEHRRLIEQRKAKYVSILRCCCVEV